MRDGLGDVEGLEMVEKEGRKGKRKGDGSERVKEIGNVVCLSSYSSVYICFSLSIGFREEDGDKWVRGCIIVLGIVKGEERKEKKGR